MNLAHEISDVLGRRHRIRSCLLSAITGETVGSVDVQGAGTCQLDGGDRIAPTASGTRPGFLTGSQGLRSDLVGHRHHPGSDVAHVAPVASRLLGHG